jgi:DNA-directed RNA polymerase subunit RPC12/RpoP
VKARQYIMTCRHCQKEYDLIKLVKATRGRELNCPSCNARLGSKN